MAMQRGLGPRESRDRRNDCSPTRPSTPLQRRTQRHSVSVPASAAAYEAVPEDIFPNQIKSVSKSLNIIQHPAGAQDSLDIYMQKLARRSH